VAEVEYFLTRIQNPGLPSFAAIVRTTGSRPELLQDALQSIALQQFPCHAVIVVHGDNRRYSDVKSACEAQAVVLHAGDTNRRRGYPINVGLDYCAATFPALNFVFFLDDDDIVYPFYTATMAAAFHASEADVVYAASNRRSPGQPTEPGYAPKPIYNVFRENFIPVNSFALRFSALLRSGVRMSEDLEYTEDWHFLLKLLEAGLRFHPLSAVLSEFRIVSDGNLMEKKDPATWKAISLEIRRFINTASFPIPGAELTRWAGPDALSCAPEALVPTAFNIRGGPEEALVAAMRGRILAMENSLSWRCTAPLRIALGLLLRVGARRNQGT